MASAGREVEIKLAVKDAQAARRLLHSAGFRVAKRRIFEANTVFDTPGLTLRAGQQLLRVREVRGETIVTYKGPPQASRHKDREELEVDVSVADAMSAIFDRLGFQPVFRYEKYRTEYRKAGSSGVATLDETLVGVFLELEGAAAWIDKTARQLGYKHDDYILASYGRLYLNWCEQRGCKPGDMLLPRK